LSNFVPLKKEKTNKQSNLQLFPVDCRNIWKPDLPLCRRQKARR